MKLHTIIHPNQFILSLSWTLFVLFMVIVLPWVSQTSREAGLLESIDTNFSFNALDMFRIIDSYGESGRLFYVIQRWTFDVVWPLVYTLPLWLTLRLLPLKAFQLMPLLAMSFDYVENIVFTILVLVFPVEIIPLAYLGVTLSAIKWTFLIMSTLFSLGVPFFLLFKKKAPGNHA